MAKVINNVNIDQIFNSQYNMIDQLINKQQRQHDKYYYPIKSTNDKIECIVCGGHYVRSLKSIHIKTKKHIRELDNIKQVFKKNYN